MSLELQQYLIEHGLEQLIAEYQIKVTRHKEFPNLVCLKYSQVKSPMSEKIVQQCRGIILDEADNWKVIAYPYDKFFNADEVLAANINWSSAKVYEKLDGSLMTLYSYQGKWHVATSGIADASGKIGSHDITFAELFWQVFRELRYKLPDPRIDWHNYMFELMTPYNQVVVRHKTNRLVLHGARSLVDLRELDPTILALSWSWRHVNVYPFLNSIDKVKNASQKAKAVEREGYVVRDRNFNRIKIKSSEYVALSLLKSSAEKSNTNMLKLILSNESSEFLTYFPELKSLYEDVKNKYDSLIEQIEQSYEKYSNIESQKDFALAIKHLDYSSILFALRSGKSTSVRESIGKTSIFKLKSLLGISD